MSQTSLPKLLLEGSIDSLTVIEIVGDDALSYLNRQVSNDLKKLTGPLTGSLNDSDVTINKLFGFDWQWNSLCNAKGRVIATFILSKEHNGFNLICHKSMAEKLIAFFSKFKFRAKVNFSLSSKSVFFVSKTLLSTIADNGQIKEKGIIRLDLPSTDYQIILVDEEVLKSINEAENTEVGSQNNQKNNHDVNKFWNNYLFQQGVALITDKTTELFVAQHINLDKMDAISFSKGCFPGQEIIARLHYKGKSKKSLQLLTLDNINENSLNEIWLTEEGQSFLFNGDRYTMVAKLNLNDIFYCQAVG